MTTNEYFLVASCILNMVMFFLFLKARSDIEMKEQESRMDTFKNSTYNQIDHIQDRLNRLEMCCKSPNREV